MYFRQDEYLQYYKILGDGIPMLCLPPFPWERLIYRAQEPQETCAQLIIPDYRGLGRSTSACMPWVPNGVTIVIPPRPFQHPVMQQYRDEIVALYRN